MNVKLKIKFMNPFFFKMKQNLGSALTKKKYKVIINSWQQNCFNHTHNGDSPVIVVVVVVVWLKKFSTLSCSTKLYLVHFFFITTDLHGNFFSVLFCFVIHWSISLMNELMLIVVVVDEFCFFFHYNLSIHLFFCFVYN